MKKISLLVLALTGILAAMTQVACSQCPPTDARCNSGVGGGGAGGGTGGGSTQDRYLRYTLDDKPSDRYYLDLVVDKTKNRIGIAYIAGTGEIPIIYLPGDAGIATDGGTTPSYDVRYVEWEEGIASTPQVIDTVQRTVGMSIDFNPTTGQPAVAYLGGGSGNSLYWFNSDAEISFRTGTSTWTKEAAAETSDQVLCGNPVSDIAGAAGGVVVGLWPAMKYDSTGSVWFCYRDVHTGQYPQGDWAGSDVECLHGTTGSWTRECTKSGGNDKGAWGGRMQMRMINDQPTLTYDQTLGGADTSGSNVFIQQRSATGWGNNGAVLTIAAVQSGGSLAYDETEGIGIAAVDATQNILYYTNKPTGMPFRTADPVFGEGTGGWYPSLAIDPMFHEPAIAFYKCSAQNNKNPSQCNDSDDKVVVAQRISGNWNIETVTEDGANLIRMAFLPNGKRVIAYRERKTGVLKLAVEK